ncbi:hypothetical protein [Phenylobacterium sp.]|uniref:hypothetical protein n=1 Tax=Phenylobacterium sp. TaxID=1871053 RepID=UPI00286A7667|nr:hypothetical protein [Phenylobacterium sp.]
MTKVGYPGVSDPKVAFAALSDYRDALIKMQIKCRPFGTDYLILLAAKDALDTAAFHFTRDPTFYDATSQR